MYCKICGEHLYKQLSFATLFKWNYEMHIDCEESEHDCGDMVVLPMLDQMVYYDYMFPQGSVTADMEYLFTKFFGKRLRYHLENQDWSILLLMDEITDGDDLALALQLGSGVVIMIAFFDETLVTTSR